MARPLEYNWANGTVALSTIAVVVAAVLHLSHTADGPSVVLKVAGKGCVPDAGDQQRWRLLELPRLGSTTAPPYMLAVRGSGAIGAAREASAFFAPVPDLCRAAAADQAMWPALERRHGSQAERGSPSAPATESMLHALCSSRLAGAGEDEAAPPSLSVSDLWAALVADAGADDAGPAKAAPDRGAPSVDRTRTSRRGGILHLCSPAACPLAYLTRQHAQRRWRSPNHTHDRGRVGLPCPAPLDVFVSLVGDDEDARPVGCHLQRSGALVQHICHDPPRCAADADAVDGRRGTPPPAQVLGALPASVAAAVAPTAERNATGVSLRTTALWDSQRRRGGLWRPIRTTRLAAATFAGLSHRWSPARPACDPTPDPREPRRRIRPSLAYVHVPGELSSVATVAFLHDLALAWAARRDGLPRRGTSTAGHADLPPPEEPVPHTVVFVASPAAAADDPLAHAGIDAVATLTGLRPPAPTAAPAYTIYPVHGADCLRRWAASQTTGTAPSMLQFVRDAFLLNSAQAPPSPCTLVLSTRHRTVHSIFGAYATAAGCGRDAADRAACALLLRRQAHPAPAPTLHHDDTSYTARPITTTTPQANHHALPHLSSASAISLIAAIAVALLRGIARFRSTQTPAHLQ